MSGIPAGAGSLLGKRLGKYEILALLALGGTAEIYLARIGGAAGFEKYVVVKCLHDHLADDPEFVKMFLDEARLAACLDHSNIVQTMELGEHENRYFMVMEFLAGLSLAMVVRRAGERLPGGRIPVPLVINIAAQSCAGLHYAHERQSNGKPLNIVHRDISPQNLVISFEGVVKVVDFGIAKAEHRETKTKSGTIKGKFAYMSPEQCIATNVDRRTDVFALGVITHELLTGRRLFKRGSAYETYQAVIDCKVEPPSKANIEVDPALDPIIMKAVAKDKDERYPTAEAFGDALAGYLHHRGKGSGPGDVSRFFDASFAQEIEEHGARMRELISGRDFAVDTGVKWDGGEEPRREDETVDLGAVKDDKSMSLDTADLMPERPSAASLSDVIDDLQPPDDDDIPAERTRIEANPLEKLKELNKIPVAPKTTGSMPVANVQPPHAHEIPASGALALPAPPTGPFSAAADAAPPKARFPEYANLPTMIAEPDPEPDDPDMAETQLGGHGMIAALAMEQQAAQPMNGQAAQQHEQPQQHQHSAPQVMPQRPSANLPSGYPVMDSQLSAQMAAGATVFPSESGRRRQPESGLQQANNDPHRALDLASPVGNQHGDHVDWAAAAAAPARAIPPWMLAVIFLGAIGVALTITIIIARIVR
ncbi:MAG: serine/threonine protein kinase [Deltaproteobacteria bacterium]|nr:serine/threonine protein kinase [Deltaproteobacteria bacterium]MDQ3297068.1 serine/threonine protein kinase [Myxococcota bacterium]